MSLQTSSVAADGAFTITWLNVEQTPEQASDLPHPTDAKISKVAKVDNHYGYPCTASADAGFGRSQTADAVRSDKSVRKA
ncbi:hypothetical protein CLAFUW4_02182 [Fulvia fulva]|uniref:Uncharacterized protein n=1 Tax=Passalora fulva TaxID=5499 RepID=A0A9Q8P2K7_PASFU|nr:uncharacterized protein CLAFUR5_02174 [Fulvia fulva]KAK4635055.1 hypothetical protein CLAFUR4_02177 [Fulvia fulva]KAK4638598.1 hypothetical protein CLAFUR0_02180 [Fulvia fulva]UJO10816.1 hypothetical protein CLAFUR5_02174 [Fulvia fulva]WPV10287.1 hypothetical protein CLAFUW4_02182 [Fulvia fulva]WPV24658.1 hypothetical protein CLAFUW7_02182 [Fulvia fulva]